MNEKIISYIKTEISMSPLTDIEFDEDLLGNGIVDSLGMVKLTVFLEREFKIKIAPEDMTVENFNTIQSISHYLSEKLDQAKNK
ncbi:acyl carrier protein [Pricia sp. S334]|uniref:Acyl carrier protein n=1 Tax=Pricia mediterranea TaxID=3076079 RepID=A0ABU3L0R8_9FLAO|nr:acyl carrier protein [Pricia sp. S334]MDT7827317.1 acyl carrier protein [Pricia sp. S334]